MTESTEGTSDNAPTPTGDPTPHARAWRRPAAIGAGVALGVGAIGIGFATYVVTNPPAEISSHLFGNKSVDFEKKPAISVDNGTIESVTVKQIGDNHRVQGFVQDNGASYQLDTSDLDFGTKYRVIAVATNARGQETVRKDSFRTFAPTSFVATTVNVEDGATYGVGMPITINFSQPVTNRAKVEQLLNVQTDADTSIPGSWSWTGDASVTYRPKDYWPAHTKVTVTGNIKGVRIGSGGAAEENIHRTFKIGARQIITVDSNTHQMVVKKNRKVIQTFPVSLGRPGHETRSGTKVLMSREQNVTFDAASLGVPEGDPDYYRLEIAYAMRVTWSGEYIHSAPWSVGSQGYSNVSHGCTNVSTQNAIWLYENTHVGDIVKFQNTGREVEDGNGITVWNDSWREWQAGSARAPQQG